MKPGMIAVACALVTVAQSGFSAESFFAKIEWEPVFGLQMKNLGFQADSLKGTSSLPADAGGRFDVDMASASLGLTASYEDYYLTLNFEDSIDESFTSTTIPFAGTQAAVKYEDLDIIFGTHVVFGIKTFLGYSKDEVISKTVTSTLAAQSPRYVQTFKEDGFFVGASYSLPIYDKGTVSFSASYAFLDGVYDDNFTSPGLDFEYEGDSEGSNVELVWRAPLTEKMSYFVDLRYQVYSFEGDDGNGNFRGSKVEIEKKIGSYGAGLQWNF